jgi:hypothetical protein
MSTFNFSNLTDDVRQLMLDEVEFDNERDKVYISGRLNEEGRKAYFNFLIKAIENGNELTLQVDLENGDYFNETELRKDKTVKVPSNAAQLLAQSEFNRFYIRAVCLKAIEKKFEFVEIYRGRESSWKRPESELKIGTKVGAKLLLEDLRATIGTDPEILPEINSGLSVKV